MVSTQSDGVGNLVDALCGRLPASVPVQLPGAQPQRRPGILTEVGRDRGDFGEDTREAARLTEALMNLLPSEGTGACSSRRDTPASAHFKDSMALVAPLILEYDDVTARQYERIVAQLQADDVGAAHFYIPPIDARVRPVSDSLQINLRQLSAEQITAFLGHCKARGMPVGLFGSTDNARNFRNWQYSPIATGVESTEEMIKAAIDVRLPLSFEEADFDQMGKVLLAALDDTLA